MAKVYITEYKKVTRDERGSMLLAGMEPCVTEQTVAIGGTSVQSNAFDEGTRFIRVHTDAICSISIDTNPTATTSTKRLAANQTEYFGVKPGDKLAVITNS